MKFLIYSFLIFNLFGCANYIKKFHQQFDADSGIVPGQVQKKKDAKDRFDFYRHTRNDTNNLSSRTNASLKPNIKRNYRPTQSRARKRYKADDLYDNGNDGSLWQSNSSSGFLFGVDTIINSGDIVVINVQKDLKSEIASELKRTFPVIRKPKIKKVAKTGDESAKPDEKANAPAPASTINSPAEAEGETKIYDKVSSVVVEEINNEHLLLKGRKYLLFRGKKRAVEIQALIARRDVLDNKTLNSDQILESTLRVIK